MVPLIERRQREAATSRRAAWWLLLPALAVLLLANVARAEAAGNPCVNPLVTNFLAADATQPGVISLYFFGADGAPVTYYECIGNRAKQLAKLQGDVAGTPTLLSDATTWSCDRLTRRFVATSPNDDGTLKAGTYSLRTMSCASRFEIAAPRQAAQGKVLRVRVSDTWGIGGISPTLCVTSPDGKRTCERVAFAKAVAVVKRRFRPKARGRMLVEVRVRDRRVRSAAIAIGVKRGREKQLPTVLATGDSMMQGIDSYLSDELGETATLRSDVRPGTAIGKGLDWLQWSKSQASRVRPSATVMAIGANEGWPAKTPAGQTVECCDEVWEDELARRIRAMMKTYLRRGHGRMVWLTLPAPRGDAKTAIFEAVNRAIIRAGDKLPRTTIVRSDLIFTPEGYRESMRYRGVTVRVREPDGIHLNAAGTAIAAKEIAAALREL